MDEWLPILQRFGILESLASLTTTVSFDSYISFCTLFFKTNLSDDDMWIALRLLGN
jgi:hypothetical protein